jgi:glycosyltransferase involved in cell wall biosynthesis
MRLAYVITRGDDLGGAQIHVRDVSSALKDEGHQVAVFAGKRGVLARQLDQLGVPYVEIPELQRELRPARDARAYRKLRNALRDFAPDLVSTHTAKAGFLGRAAARSLGIPVLFTAHGWAFADGVPAARRALYRWLERAAAPLADRIIVVSDGDRQTAMRERVANMDKLRLVYNGMTAISENLFARVDAEPVRLVSIARLAEQKDHETLFHALAELQDMKWEIDLIGDGPLRDQISDLAHELGIADRVFFLGLREDVAQCLARAQIFLLVSNWEGFPRSILEAMRAGLPVIASDVGGVRESVSDGTNGYLVPRSDTDTLADRLRCLIESTSLRLSMGKEGRVHYEQRFTFERTLDETLTVYRELVDFT